MLEDCVLKVSIAEDDLMIADLVEEILVDEGYEVCGIARTVAEAVALAQHHKPDLAVLDLRLADGGLGTDIAAELLPFGKIGVLYATGNISQVVLTTADGDASLSKPYRSADLLRSLEIVAEIVATGKALPPFPKGLRCMITASRRARATIAFFIPRRRAICMAHALSQDHFFECIML
jgi:DNA-binding response OmpR family regulator